MKKLFIEIRPGEGGEDARLLVREQSRIYQRFAARHGMTVEVSDNGKS